MDAGPVAAGAWRFRCRGGRRAARLHFPPSPSADLGGPRGASAAHVMNNTQEKAPDQFDSGLFALCAVSANGEARVQISLS